MGTKAKSLAIAAALAPYTVTFGAFLGRYSDTALVISLIAVAGWFGLMIYISRVIVDFSESERALLTYWNNSGILAIAISLVLGIVPVVVLPLVGGKLGWNWTTGSYYMGAATALVACATAATLWGFWVKFRGQLDSS